MTTVFRRAATVAGILLTSSTAFGAASPGLTKIYESFVVAKAAADRCGAPDAETTRKFQANFEVVSLFARKELRARFPNSTDAAADAALKDQADKITRRVDDIVKADGCKDGKVQNMLDAYRRHADWSATASQ
jgi:hypothetical protein